MISSDPYRWLRPYFAELLKLPQFRLLAPTFQFDVLLEVVAADHPGPAARLADATSQASKVGVVGWLTNACNVGPTAQEQELWRVRKGDRELRCVVVYTPIGPDLRLMEGDDFRRTQLHRDGPVLEARAEEWLRLLRTNGWQIAGE